MNAVELRRLELFLAVAEEGQFTRAARRCHIAQSALSTAIRSLEQELGAALFTRTTRRVELTDSGRALVPEARRTLKAARNAREAVQGVQQLLRGSLAVGGVRATGMINQAALLAEFRRRHPALEIRYVVDTSNALMRQVAEGELDVAFVSLASRLPEHIEATEVATEALMFVCLADHPLAGLPAVPLQALDRETFVGPPRGSAGDESVARVFVAAQVERDMPFEVNDVPTMLEFVAQGLGVALLPESAASTHPQLRAVPLEGPAFTWTMVAIAPTADRRTAAAGAFLDVLNDRASS